MKGGDEGENLYLYLSLYIYKETIGCCLKQFGRVCVVAPSSAVLTEKQILIFSKKYKTDYMHAMQKTSELHFNLICSVNLVYLVQFVGQIQNIRLIG